MPWQVDALADDKQIGSARLVDRVQEARIDEQAPERVARVVQLRQREVGRIDRSVAVDEDGLLARRLPEHVIKERAENNPLFRSVVLINISDCSSRQKARACTALQGQSARSACLRTGRTDSDTTSTDEVQERPGALRLSSAERRFHRPHAQAPSPAPGCPSTIQLLRDASRNSLNAVGNVMLPEKVLRPLLAFAAARSARQPAPRNPRRAESASCPGGADRAFHPAGRREAGDSSDRCDQRSSSR